MTVQWVSSIGGKDTMQFQCEQNEFITLLMGNIVRTRSEK